MQETQVPSLSREDPLEEEMATHSSLLAWRIPWTEEPGGPQSMGSQRVRHNWVTKPTCKRFLSVVSVSLSLLTCDMERLFIYLLATPISLMARCLFRSFSIFKSICSLPYCWILRALCKSWIVFIRYVFGKYFLPLYGLSSSCYGSFFHRTKVLNFISLHLQASQVALVVKNPPAKAGDVRDKGSIPELGRSPGEEDGHSLQYSYLENSIDRRTWRATVHKVASRTRLKWLSTHILSSNTGLLENLKYGFAFPPPMALTTWGLWLWHSLLKMALPLTPRDAHGDAAQVPPDLQTHTGRGSLQPPCQDPASVLLDLEGVTCGREHGLQLLDHIRWEKEQEHVITSSEPW